MDRVLIRRLLRFHSVSPHVVGLTLFTSYAVVVLGMIQSWPLWARALGGLLPWFPIFYGEVVWTYRHYSWLALFYVLVVSQVGHFFEHVVQMVQIHMLGLTGPAAQGVFGALNIEWVHFVWNTWVIVGALLLLRCFSANPWLWGAAILAGWHEIEHIFIMSVYLLSGKSGTPGLLAKGGLIGGGLPLPRADLHFLYNLVETVPLVFAFAYQLKRSYDQVAQSAIG